MIVEFIIGLVLVSLIAFCLWRFSKIFINIYIKNLETDEESELDEFSKIVEKE